VTNEGNSRFCLAATRCHIALVGIEKILPPTATSRFSSTCWRARARRSS
jgi:L-lactate utilization protein LutB